MDRVGWTPQADKSVLLVHDMQLFYTNSLPEAGRARLLRTTAGLIASARSLSIPVVYSVAEPSLTPEHRGLLRDFHGMGMHDDPAHHTIHPDLTPRDGEVQIVKRIYSAFYATKLESVLGELDRSELLICGIYADIGCLLTAFDAFKRGIKPFFIADAMMAYTEEQHLAATEYVARLCASIWTAKTAIDALTAGNG
ncbi:hypothetical protein GCM10009830_19860 [Glycomyces endophyticus]|uniref:Isochorismatase-like domain-containing protein n=1 Tax=Glycomyces endophyticus TaxID=480996 RepID=A0ABP4SLD6_9ACTN